MLQLKCVDRKIINKLLLLLLVNWKFLNSFFFLNQSQLLSIEM